MRVARLAFVVLSLSSAPALPQTQENLGSTILFVDDHDILYRAGTQRVFQAPKRHVEQRRPGKRRVLDLHVIVAVAGRHRGVPLDGDAVEFNRVVPVSGNQVAVRASAAALPGSNPKGLNQESCSSDMASLLSLLPRRAYGQYPRVHPRTFPVGPAIQRAASRFFA